MEKSKQYFAPIKPQSNAMTLSIISSCITRVSDLLKDDTKMTTEDYLILGIHIGQAL